MNTINITTGDYVYYDYTTGKEWMELRSSEIFCCNDVFGFGYSAVSIRSAEVACISEELKYPEIVYMNAPLSIVTSGSGLGCVFLEYPEVSRTINTRIFDAQCSESEIYTIIGPTMEFKLNAGRLKFGNYFEHRIEDIFSYTKLFIESKLMLYKDCEIIEYGTRNVFSAPVEQLLNDLDVLEYDGTTHYIDTKTCKSFHMLENMCAEIGKYKEKIVNFALSHEILKLYLDDGNMVVCTRRQYFLLDSNNDNYLPQPRNCRTKSANK